MLEAKLAPFVWIQIVPDALYVSFKWIQTVSK